jgi:hypothetical protein
MPRENEKEHDIYTNTLFLIQKFFLIHKNNTTKQIIQYIPAQHNVVLSHKPLHYIKIE